MSYQGQSLYLDFSKLPKVDKRFTLGRVLNNGMSAKVYQGVDRDNGKKPVAIKVLSKLSENIELIEEEYRIFKDLSRHDNFPEFYGAFLNKSKKDEDDELWLVLEYCAGGSLADLVSGLAKKGERLPEPMVAYIVKELTAAVSYLHMNHIIHRDIKARNILITAEGHIKLADFEFCRHLKHTLSVRKTTIGSPHWMAPELITGRRPGENDEGGNSRQSDCSEGYTNSVDVWAIGITAIEIADGEPPLWNIHPVRVLFQIVHNPPPELKKPLNWSANFRDFLTECLIKNPAQRPIAQEIQEHPFLNEDLEEVVEVRKKVVAFIGKTSASADIPPEMIYRQGQLKTELNGTYTKVYPDDLAGMDDIEEEKVVLALGNRFAQGNYHTYIGDVLLIINPQTESRMYEKEYHDKYTGRARSDEEPHIFAVADRAHQDMLHHKTHQNILLSGDRNSGKSFNFVQLIRHFCHIAKGNPVSAKRIEQLPFILDTFGNAATGGNANSSRHCRYIDLCFTQTGKLCGAIIFIYMLEKWRICDDTLSKSNRNFHIFYYIYYGLKKDGLLKKYSLEGESNFRYMPTGGTNAEEVFYLAGFQKLKEYLKDWEMDKEEKEYIFETIAGILLLGELDFEYDRSVSVRNHHTLAKVACLLKVNQGRLGMALCGTDAQACGIEFNDPVAQAKFACDALARGLYSRLFDWLVNTLNTTMCLGRKIFGEKFTIGLMDPPGFDTNNKRNSFEQLFTNITNEQMAYHYCQCIFVSELQDCKEEGIASDDFVFDDNREAMNSMLSKPEGLLAVIDDHTRDTNKMSSLNEALKKTLSKYVTTESDSFRVKHFAGEVNYQTRDMYMRNRDYLPEELIETLRESSDERMVAVFTNKMTKTGHVITTDAGPPPKAYEKVKSKGFNTPSQAAHSQRREMQTLAVQTRHTLIQILKKTARGDPHFVRCLKRGQTSGLDKQYLQQQIRIFNVVETVNIRKFGFTSRIPFAEFLRRYQFLAFDFEETVEMTGDNCRLLLLRMKCEGWKLGQSKVFIKYYSEEFLSRLYESQVKKIVKIQAVLRAVMTKIHKKRGILKPGTKQPKKAKDLTQNEAATIIQTNFRGYLARKEMGIDKKSKDKAGIKNDAGNKKKVPLTEKEAARIIQYYWKKWKKNSVYQQLLFIRADKQQQLTYFCQQVHVFNQEFSGTVRKTSREIKDPSSIFVESRRPFSIPNNKRLLKKMPLLMKNRHFLDTTFMCVDKVDRSKITGKNRGFGAGYDQDNVVRPSSYQRNPSANASKNVVKSETYKYDPTKVASSVKARATEFSGKQPPSKGLSKPIAPKKPPGSFVPKPSANPPGHSSIVKEIEQRAAQYGKTEDEAAPFNFQGMLRKTNNQRGSMKRPVSDGNLPSHLTQNAPSSVVYNSKKSVKKHSAPAPPRTRALSPTQMEIAPGLILDGASEDL